MEKVIQNKFKVGDIIAGNNSYYSYTNYDMTEGLVTAIMDDTEIIVKILKHKTNPSQIGNTFPVESKYFNLIPNSTIFNKIVQIIEAPNGAVGINGHIGLIVDQDMANTLIENNFKQCGLSESFYYFIPFNLYYYDTKYYKGEIWGLGNRFEDIYLKDIQTGKIYNIPKKEMTVAEIEKELGYKIKVISKEEN